MTSGVGFFGFFVVAAMRETATKLTDAQQEVESLRYELERLRETSNESASSIAVERRLLVDRVASLEDQLAAAEERLVETREGSNGLNEALAAKTEEAEGLARNVEELKAQLETVQVRRNALRRPSSAPSNSCIRSTCGCLTPLRFGLRAS